MKLQHIFYCISKQNNKIRCTQPTCLLIILRILFGPFADQKKGGGGVEEEKGASGSGAHLQFQCLAGKGRQISVC